MSLHLFYNKKGITIKYNLILHYNKACVIMHITINYKVMDITKCKGQGCPIKDQCKRYTAKESFLQSYFMESPIADGKCDMYWGEDSENIFNQLKTILNKQD